MKYDLGDVVEYTSFDGRKRRTTVENRDPDIKNGRPGFDGILDDGTMVWGYDSQITRIIKIYE